MKMQVYPSSPSGSIKAIASKSVAHRLLICAAFADKKTVIRCDETNNDIEATAACLSALGAKITREAPYYVVEPISKENVRKNALLPAGESGSTLRFLLPVVAALGAESSFSMEGRLPMRPLSPLREELEAHGAIISEQGSNPLRANGKLSGNNYSIAGNVSSQFISGLLFALSLLPYSSTLTVTGKIESAPYINITEDALAIFGAPVKKVENVYTVSPSAFVSPEHIDVEGDWSNAAFPLALGIMGSGSVCVGGLNDNSSQGDMKIVEILQRFGGNIELTKNGYIAKSSRLHGIDIDATQIPDLVPILATVASVADGKTRIYGATRLRLKESDRLESVCAFLSSLGAEIEQTEDGLLITGKERLSGGTVSSCNDHRIAMSAAIAACICDSTVTIDQAEATNKSYPAFWNDLALLNVKHKAF